MFYDRKRREQAFEVGEQVLLSTKPISAVRNLKDRFTGLLKIVECLGTSAYRLDLPKAMG